jgi:hypothetical protein
VLQRLRLIETNRNKPFFIRFILSSNTIPVLSALSAAAATTDVPFFAYIIADATKACSGSCCRRRRRPAAEDHCTREELHDNVVGQS